MIAALIASAVLAVAVGPGGSSARSLSPRALGTPAPGAFASPAGDWLTFDLNAQRANGWPTAAGITAADLHRLRRLTIHIDGTVDSAAVALHNLVIAGRPRDVFFVTTTYGRTLAIDAANGRVLWRYTPASLHRLQGSGQVTTASPVIDPSLQYIYTTSPDGFVHKLAITSGRVVWSTRVTWDPTREKLAGGLNIDGGSLVVPTDGYYGDAPSYQGHVVTIDLLSGRITHVWNSLCSNIRTLIHPPSRCGSSDSAIWGRPGTVILPGSGDILVSTGNGPFNGRTNWGDSVLELSPTLRLLHNWTPANQQQLNQTDHDLGSTEPALLPVAGGPPLAVQGGKDGILRLLDLASVDGTAGPAGPRTGGELQRIKAPGPTDVYSQPAVARLGSRIYVFVTDGAGTAAYVLRGRRLRMAWENSRPGTSPVLADGLLFSYDEQDGLLLVLNPRSGRVERTLPAAPGHWNSPIVFDGHIVLPEGSYFTHSSGGTIDIYQRPGA